MLSEVVRVIVTLYRLVHFRHSIRLCFLKLSRKKAFTLYPQSSPQPHVQRCLNFKPFPGAFKIVVHFRIHLLVTTFFVDFLWPDNKFWAQASVDENVGLNMEYFTDSTVDNEKYIVTNKSFVYSTASPFF